MKNLELNTYPPRPDWLTDEVIESLREDLAKCPNPYTEEDIDNWVFDGEVDIKRSDAHTAKQVLEKFGLLDD